MSVSLPSAGAGASIKDVGREAGVSAATVSHVLNGTRYVSPTLRRRVEDAITRLGYRHNGLARSLRTRRSYTIGLIIPDVSNPYYPQLARGVQDAADAAGYSVFLCNSDRRPENEVRLLTVLLERRVDGIILDAAGPDPRVLAALAQRAVPVVLVGSRIEASHVPDADVVQMAPEGGRVAVRYLIDQGHRRIALIGGPPAPGNDAPAKSGGYYAALAEARIDPDPALVAQGDYTRDGGRRAMEELLALPHPPTAVFAGNDLMAIGALAAVQLAGQRVPEDVAIVGYDDIPEASVTSQPLTTVAVPKYEMGRTAAHLLFERIRWSSEAYSRRDELATEAPVGVPAPQHVVLPHHLVVRGST
jgi:LacI family transcriptional regulator